ncbi:hypothetical protein BaRGS_00002045 [Batillaria attramentaria]|uniref:Uncharacterized protein n=1 Tax=Batillaria attramentaria TaxID=370345 RepID=A0ABD0M3T3_9CAEN
MSTHSWIYSLCMELLGPAAMPKSSRTSRTLTCNSRFGPIVVELPHQKGRRTTVTVPAGRVTSVSKKIACLFTLPSPRAFSCLLSASVVVDPQLVPKRERDH